MTTKAYCMINVAENFCPNGYQDILRDLANIPEVESVERVDGICDLMVKVEAPTRLGFITDKILPKLWVKSLRVLNIEPAELSETAGLAVPEFRKVKTALPSKQ